MRIVRVFLLAGTAGFWSSAALAADTLKQGPAPAWVVHHDIPTLKATDAPVQLLLEDEQVAFEHGKITTYSEGALKIQNSQGLAAGNLAVVWQPATDTVTVNKLQIIRGGKVIDVLAGGQTFTILRRETNLDAATLDGTLTGTLQPEGLQEGDTLVLATTTEHSDPVLKGHVEAMFGMWGGVPIGVANAALQWPSDLHVNVRQTANLPVAKRSSAKGLNVLDLTGQDIQPLVPPKGAPDRFTIGRLAEASDFNSWSDLSDLMSPLYHAAAVIPASGPLHDEVETIRAASPDPKVRATQALALVQDRVRYVALLMGQGGYVPASAEQTWSRRFGDCKAKTALLLAILQSVGIQAEPVLVQTKLGDMVADRLPMVALFNHVLVRAHIAGKDYWLDGTRSGDTDLDAIQIPDFGWGLPLVQHAQLVHMVPRPLDLPSLERHVTIDASAGVYSPAPITIVESYRGDVGIALNTVYSAATAAQRDEALRDKAVGYFDGFNMDSSSTQFDKSTRVFTVTIKGSAKLNWKDRWFDIPTSSIAYDPDFSRTAGPLHDVPVAVSYPTFQKDEATLRLPHGFAAGQKLSPPVHETLAGVEYARSETVTGDVLTVDSSERSIVPEIAYKDAVAAATTLRALNNDDVYLNSGVSYALTKTDVSALADQAPTSADEYVNRGNLYLDARKDDLAIADFSAALKLDPSNEWALADRAIAYVWKHENEAAQKDIDEVARQHPGNSVALRAQGLMAEFHGDCAKAVDYFSQSLAKEPDSNFTVGHRAICEADLLHDADALSDSAQALKADPSWLDLRMVRGAIFVRQGKHAEAVAEADATANAAPTQGGALLGAANLYFRAGAKDKALATLRRAAALPGQDEHLMIARAQLLHDFGKDDEAIRVTDEAIKAHDTSPDLRLLRANIFMSGKRELVPAEADALVRDNPKSTMALVTAAKMLAAVGQTDRALKMFDAALAIKPDAIIYINRAQVRPKTDIKDRLADLDAGLKLDPGNPDALTEKARVLEDAGDYANALAALDAIKQDDMHDYVQTQRAIVLFKTGRTAEAQKLFATLRANANTPNELNSLCWAKGIEGILLDSALDDCTAALKLTPGAGNLEDSLGMVLLKMGKLDDALKAYDEAIAKKEGASSLMGRAFVYLRKGDRAHAEADAVSARKLSPKIDEEFADYGLTFDQPTAGKAAK